MPVKQLETVCVLPEATSTFVRFIDIVFPLMDPAPLIVTVTVPQASVNTWLENVRLLPLTVPTRLKPLLHDPAPRLLGRNTVLLLPPDMIITVAGFPLQSLPLNVPLNF